MLMSGTVVLLAFICKPENKHVNLEKKLHAFFKGESAELEKITQAIDKVVEDNFNDPKELLVGLTKVALDPEYALSM
ncbi:hypothetical protein ONZ45_g13963 [Pleurotus djamor]|nr:hypothetical protein ONZ45_g13963 [Pleurotus djamor]